MQGEDLRTDLGEEGVPPFPTVAVRSVGPDLPYAAADPMPLALSDGSSNTGSAIVDRVRRGVLRRRGWMIAAAILAVVSIGSGAVAFNNMKVAAVWKQRDAAAQARGDKLAGQLSDTEAQLAATQGQLTDTKGVLASVRSQLAEAQAKISTLNGQVVGIQGQLSSVANDKAKAQDQATVLGRLLTAAGSVASQLDSCVRASFDLTSAVLDAEISGYYGGLSRLISAVGAQCRAAQSANRSLQDAIASV